VLVLLGLAEGLGLCLGEDQLKPEVLALALVLLALLVLVLLFWGELGLLLWLVREPQPLLVRELELLPLLVLVRVLVPLPLLVRVLVPLPLLVRVRGLLL